MPAFSRLLLVLALAVSSLRAEEAVREVTILYTHEFDYGADNFERQMWRVRFPVLGANIFHKGTRHRYSRPWVILEKDGVRLGVIGVIGQDARSVALPSGITHLDFEEPALEVASAVDLLRPQVDLGSGSTRTAPIRRSLAIPRRTSPPPPSRARRHPPGRSG